MKVGVTGAAVALLVSGCTPSAPVADRPAASSASASAPASTGAARPHHRMPPRLRVARLPGRLPQPLAREAVAAGADRRHVVVAGGLLAGDASSRSTYRLDLRTGGSTRLTDLRTAVHDTAGSDVSGHALVIGGGNATEQSVVQARAGHGWRVVGHLPGPRSDLTAVARRGTTYLVGGYDGTVPALADVLRSRDGRRWATVARLPVPVRYAATVLVGSSLWVFGGEVAGTMVDAVQQIDLHTGRARVAGHLPGPLGHSVAVRLGRRVLLVGGRTSATGVTARMWWFRPGTVGFRSAGRLPRPLADSAAVGAGSTAYLVGGERPGLSDRVLRLTWGSRESGPVQRPPLMLGQ